MNGLSAKEAFSKLPRRLYNFFAKYPPRPFVEYSDKPLAIQDPKMNPFLPSKNVETGRWYGAKYSGRRSAELVKLASKFGLQDLLPPLPHRQFFADKYYNKNWMRGVLTHKKQKWERELPEKLKARNDAIAKMDDIIAATRPRYKKQLEKRKEKEKKWW